MLSHSLISMHHPEAKTFTTTTTTQNHHISASLDSPQHLIIIDSQVEDYRRLVTGVISGSVVVILDGQKNGIEQINKAVKTPQDFNTIHLVSHGYPGGFKLGNCQLNLDTLEQYSAQIQQWKIPNILLYGCQVAAGDAGIEFIEKLHDLTGANIAASAKRTGNLEQGGDWDLEITRGQFEITLAFNQQTQQQWNFVLNDTLPDQPYFFQVIDGILKLLNPLTGDYVDIGSQQEVYNATGFNTNDNYIYGLGREGTIADQVIRIKADGTVEDLGITVTTKATDTSKLPIYAADVDNNDTLWLRQGEDLIQVKITDNTIAPVTVTFTDNTGTEDASNVADLIWVDSGGSGSLYGVHSGELYVWNIDAQTIETVSIDDSSLEASLQLPPGVYGAAWIDNQGDLYVSHNGNPDNNIKGKLYRIDNFKTNNPTAAYITETAATTKNDGMSDPEQKSPFVVPFIDLDGSGGTEFDVFNHETTFTEDSGGIGIVASNNADETQDVLIRDFDQDENNQLISQATITLTNKQDSDQLIVGTLPAGIVSTTTETDGEIVVTLIAAAGVSPEDFEEALEAITFNNTSDVPDETPRTIEVFLTDPDDNNGNITTTTVNIQPVNDPPSFSSLDNSPSYTLGEDAVVLDSDATISDLELDDVDNYDGATLTLERNGGANTEDVFDISGGTLTEGGDLTVNGTVIGEVTTNSNGTLVFTFNSDATADLVDQALQQITYSNTGTSTGSVTLDYTINDGNTDAQGTGGSLTGTGSITVNLTNNNDPVASNSSITVDESSVDTNLGLTQPTDADGDDLTITVTELPDLGTVTTADGTTISVGDTLTETQLTELIYDAPSDYDGTTDPGDFSYQVTDGNGGSNTGTVDIAINSVNNDPPVADDSSITVDESSVDTNLGLTQPTDADGDDLTITVTELPDLGTVTTADGTTISVGDTLTETQLTELIYDAPSDYDGTTDPGDFSYQVTDGNGGSNTGTVDIAINTVNDQPVAENDSVGTTKDSAVTIDVLADNGNGEDSDPNNDELSVTQVNGTDINPGDTITLDSGALLTLNDDGTFSYDPNGQFDGLTGTTTDTDSFTYTISDGTDSSEATVTVTIAGENSPPIAEDDADSTDANTVLTGSVFTDNGNGEDSDPDNNDITVSRVNDETVNVGQPILLDSGAEITLNADGTFSYNPNGQFASLGVGETATETLTYTINDGITDSDPATVTITINGVNDDPVATEDSLQTSPQRPLTFDPLTNDTDPDGDDLTLESIDSQPSNGQLVQNPDGTLTYIPNPNFVGTDSFTYTINDGNGATSTATVTIDVNPDADGDGILDLEDLDDDNDGIPDSDEGTGDTDGDGVPDRFDLDSDNDGISDLDESGLSPETIAELDTDGNGVIDTPVGENGLADNIETTPDSGELDLDGDGEPDDSIDTDSDGVPDFQDLDSDNDGILDVTEVGNPDTNGDGIVDGEDSDGNGLIDTVDPSNDNPLTVPPDSDADGVPDHRDLDSDNDGIHDVTESWLSPNIFLGGLDDPDGDGIVSGSDNDGDGITDSIDQNSNGFGNTNHPSPLDSDGDGTPDYLDLDSDNDGINDIEEVGLADPDGDGRLDSSDVDGDGIADAVDQNNDGFGDIDAVDLLDSDGDGIPDFRDVNGSPVAEDDSANIAANQSITLDVLSNDSDPDGNSLSIENFDQASANGGTITLDGNNFVYTPATDFTGTDTFTYTISDGNGGTSTATITITVENEVPVANDDTETTQADTPVTINALENDSDEDGDTLSINSFDPTSANGGTITLDGDQFIYTPASGFTGSDTFTYTISDGNGGISTATITITVENEVVVDNDNNSVPVATDDNINIPVNTPITVDVLENDSDEDGDRITIDSFDSTSVNGATITLDNNQLVYTPTPDFTGTDTFTYTVSDGNGGTSTATVTITVGNGFPVATDDNINIPVNTPITVDVLENDSDEDGDRITIESFDSPSVNGGTITLDNNQLVYTPPTDFTGTDTFTYTITDEQDGTDTAIVTISVGDPTTVDDDGCSCPTVPTIDAISLPTEPQVEPLLFPEIVDSSNINIPGSDDNEILTGSSDDDFVDAAAGDDEVVLLDGNDTLIAGDGDDFAYAGLGNDLLFGNDGNDFIKGDGGNDTIVGSPSGSQPIGNTGEQDHLFGDDGDDWIGGNLGHDTLHGGQGRDRVHGGKDNDHILGELGNDTLWGEQGNDVLLGGTSNVTVEDVNGRDLLFGGDGNDTLYGNQNLDTLVAGEGDDQLHGGQGDDLLYGNTGDDIFFGEFGNDTIIGGPSGDQPLGETGDRDLIFGDAGDDWIAGNLGRDTLHAGDGNDRLHGGKDDDLLLGEMGDDTLNGEQGDDTILGGTSNDPQDPTRDLDGQDLLFGEAGNDFMDGNEANDTLVAGEGNDTAYGGKDDDLIFGNAGNDLLLGDQGDDTLCGGEGDDTLRGDQMDDGNSPAVGTNGQQDQLYGGKGNDSLLGDEGQDTLCGGEGNDTLHGGKDNDLVKGCLGDDLVLGELGDDTLMGGPGNDTLTGGEGVDTFVINPNHGNSLITDFQIGQDQLMLAGVSFTQLQITQDGNSTVITFNNQLLATLDQVNHLDLDVNQFI